MKPSPRLWDRNDEQVAEHVFDLARHVIASIHSRPSKSQCDLALLALTFRIASSWKSISTLVRNFSNEEEAKAMANDCGALIRCMYDAYLQAAHIGYKDSEERGRLYLEYAAVERHKLSQQMVTHSNALAHFVANSPLRREGEARNKREFERVKSNYMTKSKKPPHKEQLRATWYPGKLDTLAREVGKHEEYFQLCTMLNGSVPSSARAVMYGPPFSGANAVVIAMSILGQTLALVVDTLAINLEKEHAYLLNKIKISILEALSGKRKHEVE